MNTLTIGSLVALALALLVFIYWLSRVFKREGARQQSDKEREKRNEYLKKNAPNWYDKLIGTDRLFMRHPDSWPQSPGTDPGLRVESDTVSDNSGGKDSRKVSDSGGQGKGR